MHQSLSPSLSFRLWIPKVRGQPHGFFSIQLDSLYPPRWAASPPCCSNHYLSLQTRLAKAIRSQNRRRGCRLCEGERLPVIGKTDKMDIGHEASSAWTDLARWQKKDPEIWPIVRLQTEYEREAVIIIRTSWVGVKWLWNRWDELEVGYVCNGLLYRWFISNSP